MPTASVATLLGCPERHGSLVDRSFESKVAGTAVRYRVYLPPCFSGTNRRYPYVVLMHGSDSDETQWTDVLGLAEALDEGIASGALAPMIVVMPAGGELANWDLFTPGRSWEDVILAELIPRVEGQLCAWASPKGRAIGGISRGGFWAFEIGLRHPAMFAAVGGHSPFLYPEAGGPANNPLLLAGSADLPSDGPPRLWVDAGAQDYALPGIEPFVESLEARGANLEYHLYPTGEHEDGYWASRVPDYLAFYGRTWPKDVAKLPICRR